MDREIEAVAMISAQGHLAVWCDDDGMLFLRPVEAWVLHRDGIVAGVTIGTDGACRCEEDNNFIGFCRVEEAAIADKIFDEAKAQYMQRARIWKEKWQR